MKNQTLLLIALLCALQSSFSQTTVVIDIEQDAVIGFRTVFNSSDDNYGSANYYGAYAVDLTNDLNVNRSLFQFDLSSLPQNVEILSAKLNLYALGTTGALDGHTGTDNGPLLQRIVDVWDEFTVTWNNKPSSTVSNELQLAASTSATQDYLDIDVAQLVIDMIDMGNNGFLMKQPVESPLRAILFCSSDNSNMQKHPKLEVTYKMDTSIEEERRTSISILQDYNSKIAKVTVNQLMVKNGSEINLFSLDGKLLQTIPVEEVSSTINTSNLQSGVYVVQLVGTEVMASAKLVVL